LRERALLRRAGRRAAHDIRRPVAAAETASRVRERTEHVVGAAIQWIDAAVLARDTRLVEIDVADLDFLGLVGTELPARSARVLQRGLSGERELAQSLIVYPSNLIEELLRLPLDGDAGRRTGSSGRHTKRDLVLTRADAGQRRCVVGSETGER